MSTMTVNLSDTVEDATIAGAAYKKLSATVEANGMQMNQEYYMRKVGNRMMSMTITWVEGYEDQKDAILNGFAAY